jgi:hypothetical protein
MNDVDYIEPVFLLHDKWSMHSMSLVWWKKHKVTIPFVPIHKILYCSLELISFLSVFVMGNDSFAVRGLTSLWKSQNLVLRLAILPHDFVFFSYYIQSSSGKIIRIWSPLLPANSKIRSSQLPYIHHISICYVCKKLRTSLGSDSRRRLGIFLFTTASRTALGPTQPPIQWVPGALSLGVKRPGCEADYSRPSSTEVKECVDLYLRSPIRLHDVVLSKYTKHRDNFTFTLTFTLLFSGCNILFRETCWYNFSWIHEATCLLCCLAFVYVSC